MSRVVLISPPFQAEYMRNARCDFVSLSKSSWYPIWLAQAGAYLEHKGHETLLLDAQVAGLTTDQAVARCLDFKPDFVAVYSGRLSEASDIVFADELEGKGVRTVFVGPYASIDPAGMLAKTSIAKLLVCREFDLPLEELASGADPRTTANFFWKESKESQVKSTPVRPLYATEILDTFPATSPYIYKQLDIYKYKTPSEMHPFLDLMSGRGCAWGRCNFCLWVQSFVPGSVYNMRSIGHFMKEFAFIREKMPFVKSVMIQDDMLTNPRAAAIANALIEGGYKIPWSCYAKPNSKLTVETLALMKKSGCRNLHVGFESGDDAVLANIDKGATAAQALEFAKMVHAAGLHIHGDFAIGHLGETEESAEKTIALAKAINPHTAQFQIMIPFRNTRFWRQLDAAKSWGKTGEPSYEHQGGLSAEEIRAKAKEAYRRFYISPQFFRRILTSPRETFFSRLEQYWRAIPAVTWRRWVK
jgi:anaerobic magnesium-protoporphyrin IX monomethyl ester cyclase